MRLKHRTQQWDQAVKSVDDHLSIMLQGIKENDVGKMKYAVNNGIDIHTTWVGDWSLLHWAAFWNSPIAISVLKEHGASTSKTDNKGNTPLLIAAKLGNTEAAQRLISLGADRYAFNYHHQMPMHLAAENGHASTLFLLLQSPMDITLADENGNTILHCAVLSGDLALVKRLVEAGASILVTNEEGASPLRLAARQDDAKMVLYFLNRPEITAIETELDIEGWREYYTEMCQNIIQQPQVNVQNGLPTEENDESDVLNEIVNIALYRSLNCLVSIEPPDQSILKPKLDSAILRNDLPQFVDCLKKGVDLTMVPTSAFCEPPLCSAARHDRVEMMRLMITHGADPLQRNIQGASPLSIAAEFSNIDVILFLLNLPIYKAALRDTPAELARELSAKSNKLLQESISRHNIPLTKLLVSLPGLLDIERLDMNARVVLVSPKHPNVEAVLTRLPEYQDCKSFDLLASPNTGYYPSGIDRMQLEAANHDAMDSTHSVSLSRTHNRRRKPRSLSVQYQIM